MTSKINRVHPLTMANMSAKFDQEAHNSLVAIVFTRLFPSMSIVTLTFDLWPPESIGSILSSWLTCLPSLIKKIHNGLVFITFTSLFPYISILTLTFDLWPPKSIEFILSSWLTCLPSLTKKYVTVSSLSCSQGLRTDGRNHTLTDGRTEPQQRYYIPTTTRCAGTMKDRADHSSVSWPLYETWKVAGFLPSVEHYKNIYAQFENVNKFHPIIKYFIEIVLLRIRIWRNRTSPIINDVPSDAMLFSILSWRPGPVPEIKG